jgi:hypothetical protein
MSPEKRTINNVGIISSFWVINRTQTSWTPHDSAANKPKIRDSGMVSPIIKNFHARATFKNYSL